MTAPLEQRCIDTIRFLAVDMVQKANSGHPGAPMGAAPMVFTLFDRFMRFDPADPNWPDRDRFVLSAGHASAMLYSLLHLAGYAVSMDDLKEFRQLGSITPGHPEYGMTPGVEATTGPLGQGIANAVGMAIAEQSLAAKFGADLVDHHTYVLAGDGDLMEGVSYEAASLAGHLALGKLVVLYDDNQISIEGSTDLAFTEDRSARFAAQGWHVLDVADGNDVDEIAAAIEAARAETSRPSFINVRTHIGFGSPNKQDSASAHGEPLGADEVTLTKQNLGWPVEPAFLVPEDVAERFGQLADRGRNAHVAWAERLEAAAASDPQRTSEFERRMAGELPAGWDAALDTYAPQGKVATRAASGDVINLIAEGLPELIGGSADLAPSTKTTIKGGGSFSAADRTGRNLHFGVREHAMGSIVNGIAYHKGLLPFGSTFLVFSDYMRPPIRLAALSGLHNVEVFTHDSIGLGEDGPTHQPIEQLAALRAIPELLVFRPADANETAAAWRLAVTQDRPSVLALTRQGLPVLDPAVATTDNVARGGYVLADPEGAGAPDLVIIATGSEVQLALGALEPLAQRGIRARAVSMVCRELYVSQPEEYRHSVVPDGVPVLFVEAGVALGVESCGGTVAEIGIERFGSSGPGVEVMEAYGFTVGHVVDRAAAIVGR